MVFMLFSLVEEKKSCCQDFSALNVSFRLPSDSTFRYSRWRYKAVMSVCISVNKKEEEVILNVTSAPSGKERAGGEAV